LKGKFFKSLSGARLRKLMISFQYILAILLLAGAVTIYLQVSFMRSKDLGFAKDQVVVVEAPAVYDSMAGDKISFFKNNVLQIPGVQYVSASADIPGRAVVESAPITLLNGKSEDEYFGASVPGIDTSFLSTYQIRLLEGRMFEGNERMTFRIGANKESIPVLVNQEFLKHMEVKAPKDALKAKLQFWWGPELRHAEIIGVVADHHQVSLRERIEPVMYMQPQWTGWEM
jgi:putative ABC transport system permease protein